MGIWQHTSLVRYIWGISISFTFFFKFQNEYINKTQTIEQKNFLKAFIYIYN